MSPRMSKGQIRLSSSSATVQLARVGRHGVKIISRFFFKFMGDSQYTLSGMFIRYTTTLVKIVAPTDSESGTCDLLYKAGSQASRHSVTVPCNGQNE